MLTEKLYEKDSYLKEFDATVLSLVASDENSSVVILDKTAFFPEGGGQYADRGTLSGFEVLDVQIKGGEILHTLRGNLAEGEIVHGKIDCALRYRRMQNHTGEHIVSGIVHALFGFDNVGFHLGDDDVTLDFSGELTREQLDRVEELANLAVWKNQEVRVDYPSSEALLTLDYRSKLELSENVRIVSVGDVDVCACCAPHVKRTGEIGQIKLLDFIRYKGGIRLHILCGETALADYKMRYFETLSLSHILSVKQHELLAAVKALLDKNEEMKLEIKILRRKALESKIASLSAAEKNLVLFLSPDEKELVREAVNLSLPLCSGVAVALAGDDESGYRYAIGSRSIDLRASAKSINAALFGRGGGSPAMIEGSFSAKREAIEEFFSSFGN